MKNKYENLGIPLSRNEMRNIIAGKQELALPKRPVYYKPVHCFNSDTLGRVDATTQYECTFIFYSDGTYEVKSWDFGGRTDITNWT